MLKSWAVPKGPSPNPADKRLAVHVEDHPVDYVELRGRDPARQLRRGRRHRLGPRPVDRARTTSRAGLDKGKLLFELRGHKLRGRWTLVKTKRGKNEWLLIKERDAYATTQGTEDYPHDSVLSGRTVEQVADGRSARRGARRAAAQARRRAARARRARTCGRCSRRRASRSTHQDWVFELKYDGYRLVRREARRPRHAVLARGPRLHATFPDVAEIVAALPFEQLHHRRRGRRQRRARHCRASRCCRSADAITRRIEAERAALELPATLYAFDLLAFGGCDLRALPLRRAQGARCSALLPTRRAAALLRARRGARRGDVRRGASAWASRACVGKRAASPYVSKRSQRLGEGQRREVRRLRRRRLPAREERRRRVQRAAARAVPRRRAAPTRGRVGSGFAAARLHGDRAAARGDSRAPSRRPRRPS